jgi:hypothetical protein
MNSRNPINLVFRFLLELAAIFVYGLWGYSLTDGGFRILLAILFPLVFALIWGVFAVKGDPSRSGKTVVQTPGIVRLLLELMLFGAAAWMMLILDYTTVALIFGLAVVIHYFLSFDRIAWLLKQK